MAPTFSNEQEEFLVEFANQVQEVFVQLQNTAVPIAIPLLDRLNSFCAEHIADQGPAVQALLALGYVVGREADDRNEFMAEYEREMDRQRALAKQEQESGDALRGEKSEHELEKERAENEEKKRAQIAQAKANQKLKEKYSMLEMRDVMPNRKDVERAQIAREKMDWKLKAEKNLTEMMEVVMKRRREVEEEEAARAKATRYAEMIEGLKEKKRAQERRDGLKKSEKKEEKDKKKSCIKKSDPSDALRKMTVLRNARRVTFDLSEAKRVKEEKEKEIARAKAERNAEMIKKLHEKKNIEDLMNEKAPKKEDQEELDRQANDLFTEFKMLNEKRRAEKEAAEKRKEEEKEEKFEREMRDMMQKRKEEEEAEEEKRVWRIRMKAEKAARLEEEKKRLEKEEEMEKLKEEEKAQDEENDKGKEEKKGEKDEERQQPVETPTASSTPAPIAVIPPLVAATHLIVVTKNDKKKDDREKEPTSDDVPSTPLAVVSTPQAIPVAATPVTAVADNIGEGSEKRNATIKIKDEEESDVTNNDTVATPARDDTSDAVPLPPLAVVSTPQAIPIAATPLTGASNKIYVCPVCAAEKEDSKAFAAHMRYKHPRGQGESSEKRKATIKRKAEEDSDVANNAAMTTPARDATLNVSSLSMSSTPRIAKIPKTPSTTMMASGEYKCRTCTRIFANQQSCAGHIRHCGGRLSVKPAQKTAPSTSERPKRQTSIPARLRNSLN